MAELEITLACKPLGDSVVIAARGVEAMDALSNWELSVRAAHAVALNDLLGAHATITLIDEIEGSKRPIALVVIDATIEGRARSGGFLYALTLAEPEHALTMRVGYKMFLEKTSEQIVTEILKAAGIAPAAIIPRANGAYPVRMHCPQYAESEWAFVTRLLADDGISFWFETTETGEHQILLGDATGSHAGIVGDTLVPYMSAEKGTLLRSFFELWWEESVVTDATHLRDFDIRHPDVYLEGKEGDGELMHFEYPANVLDGGAAQAKAKRRLEQLQRERVVVRGKTRNVRLAPGRLIDIQGGGSDLFEQRHLITRLEHDFSRRRDLTVYENVASMSPAKGSDGAALAPFRPAIIAPPSLMHMESAVTTGASGEEIHVDDLGRVKLRFMWDRANVLDDKSSNWIRALQYPLGASMLLPRVGWEVVVGYLDGLPERPFVLGRVYNATAVVPYSLPAASATTSFQSHTTPGDGTTQEIKMSDGAGKEEFLVHATKDFSVNVGGTHTTNVDGPEEHAVGLNLTSNILGSSTHTIGGKQQVDVGLEIVHVVKGSSTEIIGAAEIINVTGNRAVVANSYYAELVGAAYGLTCNQSNVNTTGVFTRAVAGNKKMLAGIGVTESVAGARTHIVRGWRTVSLKKSYSESIIGGKRSKVSGIVNDHAGGDWGIQASYANITCDAAALHSGSKMSITAPKITIECSTLLAETLEIGGKFKVKGGMFEVSGNVTREQGGEVGG
jgi:type VI secretion system secreted protein VgrG